MTGHPLLSVHGNVIYDKCQELFQSRPITFTTPDSFLSISSWDRDTFSGSLAFQFQTVEATGLLVYTTGHAMGNADFMALEIVDGYLHLVLNQGFEPIRIVSRFKPVNDGMPHNVYFQFRNNCGQISVDGHRESFTSVSQHDRFNLSGTMAIGGSNKRVDSRNSLPRELWAGTLGKGYVGCINDLIVDGHRVDLVKTAQLQGVAGVAEYCQATQTHCHSQPCMHNGICHDGWNRFTCDCLHTSFIGSVCQTGTTLFLIHYMIFQMLFV